MGDSLLDSFRLARSLASAGIKLHVRLPRAKRAKPEPSKPRKKRAKKAKAPKHPKSHPKRPKHHENKVVRGKSGKVLHGAARKMRLKSLAKKRAKRG